LYCCITRIKTADCTPRHFGVEKHTIYSAGNFQPEPRCIGLFYYREESPRQA
jgi:hypothetical protein